MHDAMPDISSRRFRSSTPQLLKDDYLEISYDVASAVSFHHSADLLARF